MLNNKYAFLFFLLLLNLINQIDRQMMVGFAPQITADLELSDTQFGLLTGAFFAVFYSIGGLFMGVLADRFSRPRLVASGLFLWSALTAVTGMARSFGQMAAARMLVSVGEATLTPSAVTMLYDKFPLHLRGTALGVFFMGIPLGVGGSFMVAGYLGPLLGWRGSFLLLGGIGIALTLVMLSARDPRDSKDSHADGAGEPVTPIRKMPAVLYHTVKSHSTLRYAIGGALIVHFVYASNIFSQLWLVRECGFEWQEIVSIYGFVLIVAGVIGTLSGGMLSDWYSARYPGGRAGFIAIVIIILAPLFLSYRFTDPGSPLFYAGMFSGFLLVSTVYGPMFSIVQDMTPPNVRATVVGFNMLLINVISLGLGGFLIGFVSDYLGSTGIENPLTRVLFASDFTAVLSLFFFLVVAWRYYKSPPAFVEESQ